MRASSFWSHRVLRATVTSVAAVALIAVGVSAAATSGTTDRGPGYPPPKGMYAPYTNCPLKNPLMHEVAAFGIGSYTGGGLAACIDGHATSGSVTIGKITTPVTSPVDVQFGFYTPPEGATGGGAFFPAPVVPPLAGTSAILSTGPDLIPGNLTTILGCPSTNSTVENICQQASANPADNQVYAQAEEVGNLSDFNLFNWTQPVKFVLENPLLGSSCSIGSDAFPIVLHPQLSVGPGGSFGTASDPVDPSVQVITITGAVATDTTFSAPGVTGCGPGGANNVFVDEALDAGAGVPAASGTNSLTLNGNFGLAGDGASEDFGGTFTQPQDDAARLLAAFKRSTSHHGADASIRGQNVHTYPAADLRRVLRRFGLR